uniref:Uncharacterized protein n=1 Tax=mine drainage metagenome TaxID=410659 RepID=E6QJA7_9ZZZZ
MQVLPGAALQKMCKQHEQAEQFGQYANHQNRQNMRQIVEQARKVDFERNNLPEIVSRRKKQHEHHHDRDAEHRQ